MALQWNHLGHYGRALDWLGPIFKRYKSMATSTQTLTARCYQMLGNMTDAKHRLLDVLLVAPDCAYDVIRGLGISSRGIGTSLSWISFSIIHLFILSPNTCWANDSPWATIWARTPIDWSVVSICFETKG